MAKPKKKKKVEIEGRHVWVQRTDSRIVADALSRASQDPEMRAAGSKLTSVVNVLLQKYGQGVKG